MTQENRGRIIGAVILIALGLFFLTLQIFPGLRDVFNMQMVWPLIIVGIGVLLLLGALLTWTPGMMVGATFMIGLGGLLFWQNATGNWASWAYAWTLFAVFAGVGIFLMNLMQGHVRQGLMMSAGPILGGFAAFLIFGAFFGALGALGLYWPLLLILIGVVILARGFWRPGVNAESGAGSGAPQRTQSTMPQETEGKTEQAAGSEKQS